MAGDTQNTNWPQAKFHFVVAIDGVGTNLQFQEVSGLDTEAQPIEYRAGTSGAFAPARLSGLRRSANITLKRGVFAKDRALFEWMESIKQNTTSRSTVRITLLDESGRPTMTWRLMNAWPTKFAASDLKADGNEVAVETLELAHEGLTIESS